jgi:hypothetical protein
MKMNKDISAVVVGAIVSMIIAAVAAVVLANNSNMQVIRELKTMYEAGQTITSDDTERLFSSFESQLRNIKWIVSPIIVFLAGLSAGLIGNRILPILGIISATPYAILITATTIEIQYGMLLLYLGIAAFGASIPLAKNKLRSSNKTL